MTETLNEKWQGDAHSYCQEFSDFYREPGEFGDNKDNWQDKEDFASSLYHSHQDPGRQDSLPTGLYSAGCL